MRRPWLGDGLLDLGAFELAHGENFATLEATFNIQGASDAKNTEKGASLMGVCGVLAAN